ncbi:MAG: glycosyltransferase family 4 protein [Treponema sp.]|nr:glycosyltransferase family 4 protein [Treponema sp.]
MKILFVVSWYSSQNTKVLREGIFHYEQAKELKKYCDVAIYFPFDNEIDTEFSDSIEHGIRVFRRNNKNKSRLQQTINYLKDYKIIKNRFSPDIIHAHVAAGVGMIVTKWKLFYHKPYILTEHMPIEYMNLENKKNYLRQKFIYKNSSQNICVSKDLSEKLNSYYPNIKFSIIYNGIILPNNNINEKLDLFLSKDLNCGIIAAFYDKTVKGYQYLLPAIKILIEKGYNINLHICGGGQYLDYYKKMAIDLGIENNCIFYGQIEKNQVYYIISKMDFIISASIFESAGISVEEAMLLGKPLVVTRSGGASSLVNNKTAIVVDTKSTDALVKGIKNMIEKRALFNSKEIKNYAINNFSIQTVTNQYLHLYNNLLNKS